ncbi:MAG: AAA family ATPase [Anaeroplasmataceae bacterium]
MYRKISNYIEKYLTEDTDRILCIDGARQVGKTYIIRKLAQKHYKNYIEINMSDDKLGDKLFENVRSIDSFYLEVSVLAGDKMKEGNDTIIFMKSKNIQNFLLY